MPAIKSRLSGPEFRNNEWPILHPRVAYFGQYQRPVPTIISSHAAA
jgi:hypothetical protein